MQRLIIALMAMASLIVSHPNALRAQDEGHAVDPTRGPQKIDEPVDPAHSGMHSEMAAAEAEQLVIGAGKTVDSVTVSGRKLTLAGHVTHDVVAEDSELVIEKGAVVGGSVRVTDCTVDNRAGDSVKVVIQPRLVAPSGHANNSERHITTHRSVGHATAGKPQPEHDWFGSQIALMLLGLLGAALSVIATPNASRRVAEHVASEPKRDLRVGAFVGLGMLALLVADAVLLHTHTFLSYLWAPIGIMIFFAPLLVLGFGWLAAMRYTGDMVARKLNRSNEGSLYGRMSLGLFAFFLLNVILGSMSRTLGVIGLCTEVAVALMGLGATAVIAAGSGFGRRA